MITRRMTSERGIGIIENMVAIALIGIALAGSVSLMGTSFNSNKSARTNTAVIAEIQEIIDTYRQESFTTLVARFNSDLSAINSGDQVVEEQSSERSRATHSVTLTAIKTRATGIPEAVTVRVVSTQRRGKLGDRTTTFETIIANVAR